jgi:hypothetical protein
MLDLKLLNFIKNKSSALTKNPADMLEFSCLQYYKKHVDEYSNFGLIKYISEEEKNISSKDWQPDFNYYINDIGFRGQYPSVDDKQLLGIFGCSVAFGQGLSEDQIYARLISDHYSKKYLNLGIPGASCHRIALTFSAAVRVWDIETAIINLPPFTRLHYCDKDNYLQSILLTYEITINELENVRKDIVKDFSDQFLLSQTIDSIQWIIDTARSKNINLILASWDPEMIEIIQTAFNLDIVKFNILDKARDSHPGIESHRQFADDVISILASGTYTC